jgi:hypothetical protein
MTVAEQIALRVAQLPPDKQAEVVDFVEFLVARAAGGSDPAAWTDSDFRRFALAQLLAEEDTVEYTLHDCREVG